LRLASRRSDFHHIWLGEELANLLNILRLRIGDQILLLSQAIMFGSQDRDGLSDTHKLQKFRLAMAL
jgi:hypothetical protein